MEKNNPNDPLFLQFVPLLEELKPHPLHVMDPVGDCQVQKTPKFLHKYEGRFYCCLQAPAQSIAVIASDKITLMKLPKKGLARKLKSSNRIVPSPK